jgi:hypothetical protein
MTITLRVLILAENDYGRVLIVRELRQTQQVKQVQDAQSMTTTLTTKTWDVVSRTWRYLVTAFRSAIVPEAGTLPPQLWRGRNTVENVAIGSNVTNYVVCWKTRDRRYRNPKKRVGREIQADCPKVAWGR